MQGSVASAPVSNLSDHRVLADNLGDSLKDLTVSVVTRCEPAPINVRAGPRYTALWPAAGLVALAAGRAGGARPQPVRARRRRLRGAVPVGRPRRALRVPARRARAQREKLHA